MLPVVRWAVAVAAAVPPLVVAGLVAAHARNVPWKDQWGLVPFTAAVSRGELRLDLLWSQVNEHRIPLTLLLQGALAKATRWDVRWEAWVNVVAAGLSLGALVALSRRTIAPASPVAAGLCSIVASPIAFSLAGGINWSWGSMNATYLAALCAAVLAWQVAAWDGSWPRTLGLVACATAGAFSFGAGVVLVVLLPLALLATTSVEVERRTTHAIAAAMWAGSVIALYFVGWEPRAGEARPAMHWDRLADYVRYVLLYVGGGLGADDVGTALLTGLVLSAMLVAASVCLWTQGGPLRAALVPWWLLAGYSVANGALTAFGRLETDLVTALFVRYLPTASLFTLAAFAVSALAAATLPRRSSRTAALAVLGLVTVVALPPFVAGSVQGARNIGRLARQLEAGAACLPTCATASDECLLRLCWSADVARAMCPLMAGARIGPFAP